MSKKKGNKKADQPTLISFLLDRSGSMFSIKNDVIGGYNSFLTDQAKEPGECDFILTQFDTEGIDLGPQLDIADVAPLTADTYVPRSGTPLLDAIGKTVNRVKTLDFKGKVLFVIFTDGQENSSKEYKRDDIKALIAEQEAKGWAFLFLGSDIDAYAEGGQFGFATATTANVRGANTQATYAAVGDSVTSFRAGDENWMAPVKDEEKRQKNKNVTPSPTR